MEALGETDRTREEKLIPREKRDGERKQIVTDGREEIKRKIGKRNEQREVSDREERKTLTGKGKHETAQQGS